MNHDPVLRSPISLRLNARPLKEIMEALSGLSSQHITVSRELGEVRISLYCSGQQLREVMVAIMGTLGHGSLPTRSCFWDRAKTSDTGYKYELRRSLIGVKEEDDEIERPAMVLAGWIADIQAYSKLPEDKRKGFVTSCAFLRQFASKGESINDGDMLPLTEGLAVLDKQRVDQLVHLGRTEIPDFRPSSQAVDTVARRSGRASQESDRPSGLIVEAQQQDGDPDGNFSIAVGYRTGSPRRYPTGFVLQTTAPPDMLMGERPDAMAPKGPVVNLLEGEKVPEGPVVPRMNLTAALSRLSRVGNSNIIVEAGFRRPMVLRTTKGSFEGLLRLICWTFACDYRQVGNTYVVWSNAWAQDRRRSIADDKLARWDRSRKELGRFSFTDLLEMAQLTDWQLKSLPVLFNEFRLEGDFVNVLRTIGPMTQSREQAAKSAGGATINAPAEQLNRHLSRYFGREISPPCRVRLEDTSYGEMTQFGLVFIDRLGDSRLVRSIYSIPHGPGLPN